MNMNEIKKKRSFKDMKHHVSVIILFVLLVVLHKANPAYAVPEIGGLKVTDVTTSSFSLVWMTDVYGEPGVEIYSDIGMTNEITGLLTVSPMPVRSPEVEQAARDKRIMKVRVSGLSAASAYYVRAVTRDVNNESNVGYSPLQEVVTEGKVMPYGYAESSIYGFSNDLANFKVYLPPANGDPVSGLGNLVLIKTDASRYPVSAFVGDGIAAPWGIVDLNNLFSADGTSLDLSGGERFVITVYRGGMLPLTHYRRAPQDENMVSVVDPLKGFYADINLDGNVDSKDFEEFKAHYRTLPEDGIYNPDFNFIEDQDGIVNAREFSRFSREYGRTGVE